MKDNFNFSEEHNTNPPQAHNTPAGIRHVREHKPLHHIPRGKAWNPEILKKWWFWPASIAGLILLNIIVTAYEFFFK